MSGVEIVKVKNEDEGIRLNRWFLKYYPGLSLGRLQKLLRTKQIKVDGQRAEANTRLIAGTEIRVPPLDNEKKMPEHTEISAYDARFIEDMVIYKDDNLIVLNKPSGLAVQGGTNTQRHIDGMLDALKFDNDERPKLVHRIDKDTSGVLVLARNRKTADLLTKAFREHTLKKTVSAINMLCWQPVLLPGETIKFARILNLSGRRFWVMVSISAQIGKKAECLSINCICMPIK